MRAAGTWYSIRRRHPRSRLRTGVQCRPTIASTSCCSTSNPDTTTKKAEGPATQPPCVAATPASEATTAQTQRTATHRSFTSSTPSRPHGNCPVSTLATTRTEIRSSSRPRRATSRPGSTTSRSAAGARRPCTRTNSSHRSGSLTTTTRRTMRLSMAARRPLLPHGTTSSTSGRSGPTQMMATKLKRLRTCG